MVGRGNQLNPMKDLIISEDYPRRPPTKYDRDGYQEKGKKVL